MHQSRCPASQGRTSILSAVRNHALCSGYPLEINRVINLRRLPECEERLAVILQKSGKAAISYQPSAFSLKHKAKTRFQIPISPNSLPPARSGQRSSFRSQEKQLSAICCQLKPVSDMDTRRQSTISAPLCGQPPVAPTNATAAPRGLDTRAFVARPLIRLSKLFSFLRPTPP